MSGTTHKKQRSFLELLATGRLAEAEMLMINNPRLRKMALNLPALRHTNFFKQRIRFYREYARKNGMVTTLREGDKTTLRNEFAQSHCKIYALQKACKALMKKQDEDNIQRMRRIKRIMRIRRARRLTL